MFFFWFLGIAVTLLNTSAQHALFINLLKTFCRSKSFLLAPTMPLVTLPLPHTVHRERRQHDRFTRSQYIVGPGLEWNSRRISNETDAITTRPRAGRKKNKAMILIKLREKFRKQRFHHQKWFQSIKLRCIAGYENNCLKSGDFTKSVLFLVSTSSFFHFGLRDRWGNLCCVFFGFWHEFQWYVILGVMS